MRIYISFLLFNTVLSVNIDSLGYIVYCPCMGRFGNQADHFLGALGFAKALNRTLALPAWIEYKYGQPKSLQVPFDTYFQVEHLEKFHKVITMEDFMSDVAPLIWPIEERISFCYVGRGNGKDCNAKEGNPFGPFWDNYQIDFAQSEFYGPLNYDVHHNNMAEKWNEKYPAEKFPVLAFTGAPASFPVQKENAPLHKYLIWSNNYIEKARSFIKTILPKGAYVGIHLRNGLDWVRACEHIPQSPNLFAAAQCLGYRNEKGTATQEMCLPTKEMIVRQLKRTIKNFNTANKENTIKSVFVSSDSNHMISELNDALKRMKIPVFKHDSEPDPHVDLIVLGMSNHFIGNCISSFSSFVKRERDSNGFSSTFWGFPTEKSNLNKKNAHEEL